MKILFYGAGEFGLPTLEYLNEKHEVVMVISQPDRPAGRKRVLTPTAISAWAMAHGVALLRTDDANGDEVVERVEGLGVGASVVVAFGQKLSGVLIAASGGLVVNLHSSLLPKYRGAAPINWAMIKGERVTGVSVIELAQRMDAGKVYGSEELVIDSMETAGELHDRLAGIGPGVVGRVLADFEMGCLAGVVQDEDLACPAPKFRKGDGVIDFDLPAKAVRARVHGLTPWPGAKVCWRGAGGGEKVLKLLRVRHDPGCVHELVAGEMLDDRRVACGEGSVLELLEVQAPGGKALKIADFLRGNAMGAGDILV